jgi:alkylated DNA nucleotide flippase Atl1
MSATAPYAARIFDPANWRADRPLKVVLIGTDFQVSVWNALLQIPMGKALAYSDIADEDRQARRAARGRCRRRGQSDLLRGAVPPRGRQIRRADRLSLGPDAQAGDPRLGSRSTGRLGV